MSSLALTLIIIAALAHATWNYAAKKAGGGVLFAFVNTLLVFPVWGPVVVGVSIWDPTSSPLRWDLLAWALVILSAIIHAAYYTALLHGYRVAPLSVVYPMARGTGPLISAFSASIIFNEALTLSSVAGILMIIGGVLPLLKTHIRTLFTIVVLSPLAYMLVLYAMKIAPVSHVAPARELSLLFGAFYGGKLLKEGNLLRRTSAAAMIALGVMFLAS